MWEKQGLMQAREAWTKARLDSEAYFTNGQSQSDKGLECAQAFNRQKVPVALTAVYRTFKTNCVSTDMAPLEMMIRNTRHTMPLPVLCLIFVLTNL